MVPYCPGSFLKIHKYSLNRINFSRVACFRDDIVFLIYLYQRWLYPVDQTRIDCSGMIEETCQGENTEEKVVEPSQEKKSENNEKQTKKQQKPNKKKD